MKTKKLYDAVVLQDECVFTLGTFTTHDEAQATIDALVKTEEFNPTTDTCDVWEWEKSSAATGVATLEILKDGSCVEL